MLTVQIAQVGTLVAMAGRIHNCGARLLRILGVLTVVAGVFAMHGLTSDHDTAMAAAPSAPSPTAAHIAPAAAHIAPAAAHVAPVTAHLAPAKVQVAPGAVRVDPADEMAGMAGACVAVLTGLVLLLALLLGLRSLLVWRAVEVPVYVLDRGLAERSPPGPVLSSLGVLRI
ncbi:MAG TPA: hypothetical protein VG497_11220 [Kribbella sp.]|nr:hypothetical protein [Kribbella sp.]